MESITYLESLVWILQNHTEANASKITSSHEEGDTTS
jgi:hypothetical protein